MSIIYNRREVNSQVVLTQFVFQSYDATNDGNQANLSLDKYLGVEVWSQIYKKIEPKFLAFRYGDDLPKEEETIYVNRAQLELNISWKSVRSHHKEIARQLSEKSCDNSCAKVLNVKVRMHSAIDKFKKLHCHEKTTEKKSTVDCESNASGSTEDRTSNGSTSQSLSLSQNVEEYVPEPITDIPSSLNYTPSTLSNSMEDVVASPLVDDEHDVYTPSQKNGNNDSEIITYTPTKISHTSLKTASKRTDSNRNDCADKKSSKMKKIFGDSGDEIDNDSKSGLRFLRSTRETSQIESEKPKVQQPIDEWLNRSRSKRPDGKKDCDRIDDKKKIRKIGTNVKSERVKKEMDEDEKMRLLRDEYENEAMVHMSHHNVRIINLKDLKIEDINRTFYKYKAALQDFFRSNLKIPDYYFQPPQGEAYYLNVLTELLSETQQQKMYLRIRSEFADPVTVDHITSDHENLFWKGLLPEWALLLFMDKFELNRTDAVKQLNDQERIKLDKDFPLDLDSD